MLTPQDITIADYITAEKSGASTHVRITFLTQNVVLTDEDIVSTGIEINDYLNGETDLKFGVAVTKNVSIPIINSSKLNGLIWSGHFLLEFGVEISGVTKWVTIGRFIGTRPEKILNVDTIDFTANDLMQNFDVSADGWLDSLTYPKTVEQLFDSLCTYVGVGYSHAGDCLANIKTRSYASAPITDRGLTCKDILSWIAEACGCYARMSPTGFCKLVWFSDQTSTYTLSGDEEFAVSMFDDIPGKTHQEMSAYKHNQLHNFTHMDLMGTKAMFRVCSLNVKQTADDTGIYYPEESSGNTYYIIDNPFLLTADQTEVNDYIKPIYDRLSAFGGYIPTTVNAVGCALLEAGDIITITYNNQTYVMPIFVKSSVWNGALTDTIECTGQLNRKALSADVSQKLYEGGRYHKWKNTVDELYSELYDPTTGNISIISQQINSISLTLADKYDIISGITIDTNGIDIVGNKYVQIRSGGRFDVDSENLKIDSTPGTFNIIRDRGSGKKTYFSFGLNIGMVQPSLGEAWINEDLIALDISNVMTYPLQFYFKDRLSESGKIHTAEMLFGTWYDYDSGEIIGGLKCTHAKFDESNPNIGSGHFVIQCGILDCHYVKSDTSITTNTVYYYNLVQTSSRDIKHDIQDLPSMGDKLDSLKPVTFVYDNDTEEKTRMGLIYEDTIEVIPEICTNDENNKAINYVELIPALLKEIQDLRKRVAQLEGGI